MKPHESIRISISEAARLFGVNAQTIRRAIKDGQMEFMLVQGRYKIDFEHVLRWSQKSSHLQNKMSARGIGKFVQGWRLAEQQSLPQPAPVMVPIMPPVPNKKRPHSGGRRNALANHPTLPL